MKLKLATFLMFFSISFSFAQKIEFKESIKDNYNTISLCKLASKMQSTANNEMLLLSGILPTDSKLQIKLERTIKNKNIVHNHYQFRNTKSTTLNEGVGGNKIYR
jgi:hypothetical protein